ncbi:MAG: ribosomal protein S18-alanine N-acetyltransferase [Hominisplanchenecus sp.]
MLEIRKMQMEDLDEVAEVEKSIFSQPWSKKGFADAIGQETALYLTARVNGRLAGYCGLLQSLDEADITNVAVAEVFRNQGVASAMLNELIRCGQERGILNFTLEVRAKNAAALHLYEKLGFVSVGIRPGFYEKPREDAVIMWKYS